ncbi:pyruvate dehydrogenase (acetyl-transferring) E1 component subunit alpha [Arthrobacter sp. ISL-30]|uniref:pyruvate dehydrogenase (acetyl-transferring) E1 component subunit alpha n=1 Tax=Arthrobacter sp. ISL-30 TaxID=2819109 RepID=UPI001BE52C7E|nr:pyruvate dehydrogenase (acetyl-transferring) E1 component subunit alpha [Arthrobacter sp. ISL-30]MBT2513117.1 pyruvate dehydrogenase (acetyl-transferring) E1 component subunit alpha [Arthrobacter sp. ISL-30]
MLTDEVGPGANSPGGQGNGTTNPLRTGGNLVQLISPAGERINHPEFDVWIKDVSDYQLLSLYEDMVVIRRIDTEATALQRQGELALWPPLLGQEASQIGSVRAIRSDDFIFPSYRESGVAYCRGAELGEIIRPWRGNALYGWDPHRINMATPQIVIGSQTLHATGYAMGIQNDGADIVAFSYLGDGATSEGDVNEAMVFAASYQVPLVFFCQNNHWAISEPVRLQSRVQLADRATGFGIPSMRVDGNDVLAVMAASRIGLDRARKGGGPTFIEAVTYRMGPHTTADDPTRYRDANELEDWAAKDPIVRLKSLLSVKGLLGEEAQASVQAKADSVARELRDACATMPDPAPLDVFNHVYSTPHSWIDHQKDHYSRYLASFGGSSQEGAL